MKSWKCPNCKRERLTQKEIVSLKCICGEYLKEEGKDENKKE